jgi:hypothetical protein
MLTISKNSPLAEVIRDHTGPGLLPPVQIEGLCGLGDHIFLIGAIRWLASVSERVILDVQDFQLPDLSYAYRDVPNVHLRGKPTKLIEGLLATPDLPYLAMPMGAGGTIEHWTHQALGLPAVLSWTNYHIARDRTTEEALRQSLGLQPGDRYIVIHDDQKRGFSINKSRINPRFGVRTIHPGGSRGQSRSFPIFAWIGILEAAQEIHLIESAFAALIDRSPSITAPIHLHRYARRPIPKWRAARHRKDWQIHR